MKFFFISFYMLGQFFTAGGQEYYLLAGTYDSPKSEGIYVYKFNSSDGSVSAISHVQSSNPSYVAISPDEKFVYAVQETGKDGKGGKVAAFGFNKQSGTLTLLNKQLSGGDDPCYIEVDKTGHWVFAGNYTSGSLSVFPVNADGSLGAAVTSIQHEGSGKNMQRQKGPHVHCTVISPDNRWLFVPDLGIDKVMIYSFDAVTGNLFSATPAYSASKPGSGPRHFIFHPNNDYAYLVEELTGTVVAFNHKKGTLKEIQRTSTMPPGDSSFAGSADIHVSPDGKFLYVSNRGNSNTIAIFSINKKNGTLTLAGHQSTLGKTPRNFNFDPSGKFLLVGNQNSDEIVIFNRNSQTGLLTDSGKRVSIGKPVCIKWISTK